MRFSVELVAVLLTLSSVQAFAVPPRSLYMKSLANRSYRANPIRRDADLPAGSINRRKAQEEQQQQQKGNGGGGLKIGGLTLGGPGGGITGNGLQLGGKQNGQENRNATAPAESQAAAPAKEAPPTPPTPAKEGEKPAAPQPPAAGPAACGLPPPPPPAPPADETPPAPAGPGTENQPGSAEGEAAKAESQPAAQAEKSKGVKATEESERFSEEAGITLDGTGNAQNLGGNLGITKGSDGSTSVGGENGIQVAG